MAFMLLALPAALTAVRETGLRRGGTGASPYGMCVVRAGHVVDGDITAAGEQAPDERGARSPGSRPAKPVLRPPSGAILAPNNRLQAQPGPPVPRVSMPLFQAVTPGARTGADWQ
jgi:hypothetical protein